MICKVFHQTCYFHPCFPDKQTEVLREEVERLDLEPSPSRLGDLSVVWVPPPDVGAGSIPSKPGLSWAERALEFGG